MSNYFNLYTVFSFLGCLIAGIIFAWFLYHKTRQLPKKTRYGLAAIRALAVAVILWLLFAPLIRNISYTLEKPVIIIGQDNSLSIGNLQPAGFDKEGYQQNLRLLADRLARKYDVRIYNFSDSVKTGFDFSNQGKLSNASHLIKILNDEFLQRNVGAVILATDGIFNRGGNPSYDLAKLNAPVYPVALGDTIARKDVLIANVNYNGLVYLDNEFGIEVQVQAFESKGQQTLLNVFENGKKVFSQNIQITDQVFVKEIPVKLKATRTGLQKYTVRVSALDNELSEKNNVENFFVDVIDAREKVLIAAAAPHPDITAIKQSIELNKKYEVKVALGDELNTIQYKEYGLFILHQLPSTRFNALPFIRKIQSASSPVWYILGAESNINAFNQVQKSMVLNNANGSMQDTYSYINPAFTVFDLDAKSKKMIETFDPLQAPFGRLAGNGVSTVLLNQRIGKVNTDYPQWVFVTEEGKKTGYLAGEGLWRWKLTEAKEGHGENVFNDLISKTIQYLSVKDDKRKFKVYTSKTHYDENESIILNANLYNDSYESVNTPDVNIQIKDERGKIFNFTFSKKGSAYQLNAGIFPAGSYSYIASVVLGSEKYTVNGGFFVNSLVAEYQQTIANHQLLYSMAAETNGKTFMPADLLKIEEALDNNEQVKTLSYEDRKYEELISLKWLFVIILLLLGIEWFLRKRNGEI